MSYWPVTHIEASNSPSIDAFSRWRVSNPTSIFDNTTQFNKSPKRFEDVLTGGGTTTHLPNESSVKLSVTTSNGDKVVRQSHEYFRYQPGKSHLILMTATIGALKTNVRQRLGYFDANNGVFFEQDGTNLKVVRRTYTSGSPVDNAVNQSSWNIDPLDGTGPSGLTLDTSKANIYIFDLQWLGVGRVRMGVDIEGEIVYCHEFANANSLTTVYMTSANLPIRYELENTGVSASGTDFICICASVESEGGYERNRGVPFAIGNGTTTIGVTTRRAILTIRPRTTFNSIANRGIQYSLFFLNLYTKTNDCYFEIVWSTLGNRVTLGGVPAWTNVSTNESSIEYDVAGTTVTGGLVVASGFGISGAGNTGVIDAHLSERVLLALDVAGSTQDMLSVVLTSMTGTCNAGCSVSWFETH